ncbi:MAG: DUF4917 family protein [Gemmatimonadetes bacterium]|nr:DUF4917 family protein [Gemmatimonadota bacterium]
MTPTGDASLNAWSDIATLHSWESIVLGNGASQAVWRRFAYSSLFDVAKTAGTAAPLSSEDCDLFAALGAQANFEAVLGALLTARTVGQALNHTTAALDERYRSISEALVAAVHHVHVPWAVLDRRGCFGSELRWRATNGCSPRTTTCCCTGP